MSRISQPPSSGGGGGSGTVTSVSAASGKITVGGTATDPTVDLGTVAQSDITGLVAALAAKAPSSGIAQSAVTNLVSDLAAKAPSSGIAESAITGLVSDLAAKAPLASPTFTGTVTLPSGQALIAPALGTPASGVATNLTGTAAGLTAGAVTTNANLTGDVTSVGNATTLTNAPVIAKVLTGYTSGAGTVAATDSILQAVQKLNGNDALALPKAGGTMSGAIAMGTSKITGLGNGTATTDAAAFGQVPTNIGYAYGIHPNASSTVTGNPAVNTVYLVKNTSDDCTISTIRIGNGATVAGNVIVGTYANSGSGGSSKPTGTATASSVSTAVTGTSTKQDVALQSSIAIKRGEWLAVMYSDATTTVARGGNHAGLSDGLSWKFAAGSFALPDMTSATMVSTQVQSVLIGF